MNCISKKLLLCLTTLLCAGVWGANSASATTWYVRDGGGDSTQCTGTTNAVYPGSGSKQGCAFNHPAWVTGGGYSGSGTAALWTNGDTMSIDGDSDIAPGTQAQYMIGYGMPNTSGCSTSWAYNCLLNDVPAGLSPSQPTSIIGTGTHQPQLWGTQKLWEVIDAENNNITLQNLEITDHDACAYNDPSGGCNNTAYPYGQWAENGIFMSGDGFNFSNLYIHGLGVYGIETGNIGSFTFTSVWVIGNGYGGITIGNGGTTSITGTVTFNQPIVEWNGCVEAYPVTGGIDNPANYSNCFGQNSGGYGDGLAFGATGSQNDGNWTIIGPGSISFNTQDGLDTLHGAPSNNTIQIDKMRFEGNAGDQVKLNATNTKLTNSVVVGDCGWWFGAAQSLAGGMQDGDTCRALGDVIVFYAGSGSSTQIYNNTIFSNGNITLESGTSSTCDGTTSVNVYNNIVYGGYSWFDDTSINSAGGNGQTTFIYNDGTDGDGAGSCGSLVWNEDYNIVYGTKNNNSSCKGSHDKCGLLPGFASALPMGTAGGAANTFYQGWSGSTYAPLASNSPAITAGVTGLTYWNDENDYHNVIRTSSPTIGGLELNSCAVNGYGCFFNSDCCGGVNCSNFVCGGNSTTTAPDSPILSTAPITPTTPPVSVPPVITITNPVSGSTFTAGSSITITADASETNGTIANVSFYYNGTNLLSSSATPPYGIISTNLQPGTYTITAVATDANGISTTSSPIPITVTAPINQAVPTVTITSPASGSSFAPGSNVLITANASETNGSITNVMFYYNGILLGETTASPYDLTATNVQPGSYAVTAIATDANGVSTTSAPIAVTVTAPAPAPTSTSTSSGGSYELGGSPGLPSTGTSNPSAPTVTVTSPISGSSFTAGSNVLITTNTAETAGNIASVAFYYNGIHLLGTITSSPYNLTAINVQPGSYSVTAVATDANGVSTTSAPIAVTVTASVAPPTSSSTNTNSSTNTSPSSTSTGDSDGVLSTGNDHKHHHGSSETDDDSSATPSDTSSSNPSN